MNVKLLREIQDKLRRMRHKKHFDMQTLIKKTDCGTAACIAGHTLLHLGYKPIKERYYDDRTEFDVYQMTNPRGRTIKIWPAAKRELGLTQIQAVKLFQPEEWPVEFGGAGYHNYYGDGKPQLYNNPKVAVKRIEHFIKTKGRE